MRVEIIERSDYKSLEREINSILEYHNPSEIFDIKYTGSGNHPSYSNDYYSVMIIYK